MDTKGVAFERFMEDFFKGKMGQYFTPRELIHFCIKMLNPKTNQTILDPACGSGGFLLNAMDLIRRQAEKEHGKDTVPAYREWHDFAKDKLYGIDINDQIARVCKMNMILHDDGHTNVISVDSLTDVKEINRIHRKFEEDSFDLILTNPPFGAVVKQSENPYLQRFALGKDKDNQKTEILFIERCLAFLKSGAGRMGIVLPDGILTNSTLQYVRDFIIDSAQILAIVSLPQFAFTHFGAGVKSSLVFLRRKSKGEKIENYPIFMAVAENIGYDATGRKILENDLDRIFEEYKKFESLPSGYQGY